MGSEERRLSWWTGEFQDRKLEEAYSSFRWSRNGLVLRWFLAAATTAYAGSCILIPSTIENLGAALLNRIVLLPLLGWALYLTCRPTFSTTLRWLLMAIQVALYVTQFIEFKVLPIEGDPHDGSLAFSMAMLPVFFIFMQNRMWMTLLACALGSGLFLGYEWLAAPPDESRSADFAVALCAIGLLSIIYLRGNNAAMRKDYLAHLALAQEILDRRAAEELALSAQRQADDANEVKDRFLAVMSHEMRTPLGGVIGGLELLRAEGVSVRQGELLEMVGGCALQLGALVEEVLDLSDALPEQRMTQLEPFQLTELMEELSKAMAPVAKEKGLAFESAVEGEGPQRVVGDRRRLFQVLWKVLDNAIKYTDRGGVVLRLKKFRAGNEHVELLFSVLDTGIGMAKEKQERAFELFYKGDDTLAGRRAGAGVGLPTSKRLIEAMGGEIALQSSPGEGTAVHLRITLPAAKPGEGAEQKAEAVRAVVRPRRVVLAEDNEALRSVTKALLEREQIEVVTAATGEEAVRMVAGGGADLVLMDLHMPQMDGLLAARAIRALPNPMIAAIPIIALTADMSASQRELCRAASFQGWQAKPVSVESLLVLMSEVMTRGGGWVEGKSIGVGPPALFVRGQELDLAQLEGLREAMGSGDFTHALEQGKESIQLSLKRLERAVAAGEAPVKRREAHLLKGVAATFGMGRVRALAQELESCRVEEELQGVQRLKQAVLRAEVSLSSWQTQTRTDRTR